MAGRPRSRGERVPAGKGGYRPARGGGAHGTRPPFEPGNTLSMRSGAYSPRVAGPRAEAILAGLLADPVLPDRVKAPECRADLAKLAQLYAQAELLAAEEMDIGQFTRPRREGGRRSPMEIWLEIDGQASRLQHRLGLDPLDVLAERQEPDVEAGLERLAGLGARIRARREAQGRGEGEEE